jgi:hypothetical protein
LKGLILIVSFIVSIIGYSQTKDAHLWTGAGLSMEVNKKFSVDYKMQTRFYTNATTLRVYLNQIGGTYKVASGLKVGLKYRYSRKKKAYTYFVNENRIILDAVYGYKLKDINTKISARVRYQHAFDRLSTINETITPNTSDVFRFRLLAKYKNPDFKRVQPFIGYEYFKSLNPEPISFAVNSYRILAGISLDLPHKHEVKLNYIFQSSNGTTPEVDHIYAIQYTYNLSGLFGKNQKVVD